MEIITLFSYSFFQKALLAAILASISCGLAGTYIVARREVFISGGITHASFGGIGLGYFLGINPLLGASVFAVLFAWIIEWMSGKGQMRNDSVIAMLWSLGMAIGIIFVYLAPGYAPNLMSFLFGSILTVSALELWVLGSITLLLIAIFIVFYHSIIFISFDKSFAQSRKQPVGLVSLAIATIVSLVIVFNIKVVGIILILSLLTVPPNIASLFRKDFKGIAIWSIIFGFVGTLGGLFAAYYFEIPSGAAIIFILVLFFLSAKVIVRKSSFRLNK